MASDPRLGLYATLVLSRQGWHAQQMQQVRAVSSSPVLVGAKSQSPVPAGAGAAARVAAAQPAQAFVLPAAEDPATRLRLGALLANARTAVFTTHEATITSQDSSLIRGASLSSGAKAMLLRLSEGGFVLAVLSASESIDFRKLAALCGSKARPQMATVHEVFQVTRCFPGAVPPFGSLFRVKTYLDGSLQRQGQDINFNCGVRCGFGVRAPHLEGHSCAPSRATWR
jgi:Ala-tRNA(Pro) deacylase